MQAEWAWEGVQMSFVTNLRVARERISMKANETDTLWIKVVRQVPQAILMVVGLALVTFSIGRLASERFSGSLSSLFSQPTRALAATRAFPRAKAASDTDTVLATHTDYLRFVLEVGMDTDKATAQRLANTYENLRRRNPELAARFLKGLRFEMVQKLELLGASPAQVSTRTPTYRKWVSRWMKEWLREADEHLFRAVAFEAVKKNQVN